MKTMKTLDGIIHAVTALVAEGEVQHACGVLAEGAHQAKHMASNQMGSLDTVSALFRLWDLFEEVESFLLVAEHCRWRGETYKKRAALMEGQALAALRQVQYIVRDLSEAQVEAIEDVMREELDPHLGVHY